MNETRDIVTLSLYTCLLCLIFVLAKFYWKISSKFQNHRFLDGPGPPAETACAQSQSGHSLHPTAVWDRMWAVRCLAAEPPGTYCGLD